MNPIFALDLGTTKFCAAGIFEGPEKELRIDLVTTPATGMRRGMLSDLNLVTKGIEQLLIQAEHQFNFEVNKVALGIAGSHLRTKTVDYTTPIAESRITSRTLNQLKQEAKQKFRQGDREILHLVPTSYQIDHREQILNPINQTGNSIKAEFFVIDSDLLYIRDLVTACNRAGLEVGSIYAEPFASSSVTVPRELQNMGIAIADIGGGTTDGIVFQNGKPKGGFTFNIGGLMMTNDIAIGLNLPMTEAEKAKTYFGLSGQRTDLSLEFTDLAGSQKVVAGSDVQKILAHRILEWGEQLADCLVPFKGQLGSGLLLTGGGSSILSLAPLLRHQFEIPVQTISPSLCEVTNQKQYPGKYATALGLLYFEYQKYKKSTSHGQRWKIPFFKTVAQWVQDFS